MRIAPRNFHAFPAYDNRNHMESIAAEGDKNSPISHKESVEASYRASQSGYELFAGFRVQKACV